MGSGKIMRLSLLSIFLFPLSFLANFSGECVGVSDGDTIKVMRGGTAVKVRLLGIDCPEKKQDFGSKAKQATSDMVFGKTVDVKEAGQDKYGRTLGTVFAEGKNVNLELVKAGLAWHYKQYSKDEALSKAEAEARAAKIGLWSMPAVPPWEWRKQGKR